MEPSASTESICGTLGVEEPAQAMGAAEDPAQEPADADDSLEAEVDFPVDPPPVLLPPVGIAVTATEQMGAFLQQGVVGKGWRLLTLGIGFGLLPLLVSLAALEADLGGGGSWHLGLQPGR